MQQIQFKNLIESARSIVNPIVENGDHECEGKDCPEHKHDHENEDSGHHEIKHKGKSCKKAHPGMEHEEWEMSQNESYLNEASPKIKYAKIVKGIRDSQGPFSVVAIKGKKVVAQKNSIKNSKMLPIEVNDMADAHPGATISIESKGGKILNTFKESYMNEASQRFGGDTNIPADKKTKAYIESGRAKILINVPSALHPSARFVVAKNPNTGSNQDKVMMFTISDPDRSSRIKMFSFHGTHVSHQKAMDFAKLHKLVARKDAKGNPLYAKESYLNEVKWDKNEKRIVPKWEKGLERATSRVKGTARGLKNGKVVHEYRVGGAMIKSAVGVLFKDFKADTVEILHRGKLVYTLDKKEVMKNGKMIDESVELQDSTKESLARFIGENKFKPQKPHGIKNDPAYKKAKTKKQKLKAREQWNLKNPRDLWVGDG